MGIPRFASWLTKKFPPMARRDAPASVHGLYIDMNGIIHPCCHSEEDPGVSKRSDEEKIEQVCLAVGNLVETAKPTNILFLAMDGVAPRAKMNQQRARRYMSAVPKYGMMTGAHAVGGGGAGLGLAPRETDFTAEEKAAAKLAEKETREGIDLGIYGTDAAAPTDASPIKSADADDQNYIPGSQKRSNDRKGTTPTPTPAAADATTTDGPSFDSNCISPGTVFMRRCAERLKAFVADKLANDPVWKTLAVVVSDTNTPGEGEHKIIDFIRTQMTYGSQWSGMGYHVIHGNDADLILLCLGLHIPRVVIMRENFRTGTHGPAGTNTAAAAAAVAGTLASPGFLSPDVMSPTNPLSDGANEDGKKSDASESDASDTEGEKKSGAEDNKKPKKAGGDGKRKNGGGRGGRGGRFYPPKPRFEWYDIDVIGNCIMTELNEVSKKASGVLKVVPDFQTYSESVKKRIVVGPGGVGQVVTGRKDRKKDANNKNKEDGEKEKEKEKGGNAPMTAEETEAALAMNHATFLSRSLIPTDAATKEVLVHPCTTACNHRVIDDFITLATLMGNDFMPRLPSCFCGDSAMDNIMEVYVRCVMPYGYLSNPVTNDLDLAQLHRFFHGYAMLETTLFRQQCIKSNLLTAAEAMNLTQESLGGTACGDIRLPSPIDEKWRSLYYKSTTIGTTKEGLKQACTSYIEGIRFVLRYYSTTARTTSWSWYFPFHHSPFAADLANFLEPYLMAAKPEEALPPPKLEVTAPLPFPQLMAILPPTSSALLPAAIGKVMRNPTADLSSSTFPSSWQIDFTAADDQEHLAAVLLPFADFKQLMGLAEKLQDTFTDEEKGRNVNNAEQCVFIRKPEEEGAEGSSSAVEIAGKIIADRVRGGIEFKSEVAETPSVLRFGYVDIASRFLAKPKTYSPNYKPVEEAANNSGTTATRDEKKAKMYKRRTDQNNRVDNAGSRYFPKSFLTPTERGWFMSLADFHLGVGAIAAFVGFVFSLVGAPMAAITSASTCICVAAGNAIVTGFIFMLGSVMLCILGVGITNPRKESGIKRNNTRDAYVDWMCAECLSLNFSRNEKCYTCGAPCDEGSSSWAIFSNKLPPRGPPHLEPDHKPYIMDVAVKFPKDEDNNESRMGSPAASGGNCDML